MTANKYQYSRKISEYRYKGKLDEAISSAQEAIKIYDKEDIFWKLLGDLLLQKKQYEKAGRAYIEFLKRIHDHLEYFKNFAVFWRNFKEKASNEIYAAVENALIKEFNENKFSKGVCQQLAEMFVKENYSTDNFYIIENRKSISMIKSWIDKKEEEKNQWEIYLFLFEILQDVHNMSTRASDKYIVSVMERYEAYVQAIQLVSAVLQYDKDDVLVRTLFRLCRKTGDYTKAEDYVHEHPDILKKGNFNIQYELVYYYDTVGDEHGLLKVLSLMRNSAERSIPISRTLYNFYLRFGMIDEAADQREHTEKLIAARKGKPVRSEKGIEQEKESEEAVWMKFKDLISEQEHNRQLLAMKELLKGFSHELGQPVTNIRYAVQLHQMKLERNIGTQEETEVLLNSILKQTVRIKQLLNRFSPIVSGKSENIKFCVGDRITNILDELESRLTAGNIHTEFWAEDRLFLKGDAVQFDQVFYNLIANSIEAMKDKKNGKISICVKSNKKGEIVIEFYDNGPGISKDISRKIFEPFYSTKDKQKEEGGEGLGMFIVWNILKMYGGKIRIDYNYHEGAKFVMQIPKKE